MVGAVPVVHFQSALNCRVPGRTNKNRLQCLLKHFRLVCMCRTLSVISGQPEGTLMGGGTGASGVRGKLQLLSDDSSDALLVQLLDRYGPVVRYIQLGVFYKVSYNLEWSNSGKDLDCKIKCRARVVLSMTFYMCMLGAFPF